VVVVVLTQNNQPILPDLERKESPPEQPSSTPTQPTSSREESSPTPTLTATPTASPTLIPLPPCTDTDGGKDYFTKGTVTTSYGDKKTDFCSDPNIVGEYSCVPGAIFAFDGFICPGSCSDGACLRVTPTPTPTQIITPTRILTPTITPTPTNVPCTDSDGGKDIYTKGTVNTWGKSYDDFCYSLQTGQSLFQCSDYFCRLLEYSCQPMGYLGEGFTCQYGCKDGACIKTPPTATPTPFCLDSDGGKNYFVKGSVQTQDKTITDECYLPSHGTSTPKCTDNTGVGCKLKEAYCGANKEALTELHPVIDCNDGVSVWELGGPSPTRPVTPTLAPSPTVKPAPTDLTFVYEGDIEQKYKNVTQKDLKETIQKIYQETKNVYGPPFRTNTVKIKLGGSVYYNATTNELTIREENLNSESTWIGLVLDAFHDEAEYFLPENWAYGLWYVATKEIYYKAFAPDRYNETRFPNPFYEITGFNPVWASKNGKLLDTGLSPQPDPYTAVATPIYKIFLEDNQFFVNFNKALYLQPMDNTLKDKIASLAKEAKSQVEGITFDDWYSQNAILHVNHTPGKYLIPVLMVDNNAYKLKIGAKAVEVLESGEKKAKSNLSLNLKIYKQDGGEILSVNKTTQQDGSADLGTLPDHSQGVGIPDNYVGSFRVELTVPNFGSITYYYPYIFGKPCLPGLSPKPGLFGVVINKSGGIYSVKSGENVLWYNEVIEGGFTAGGAYNAKGQIDFIYDDLSGGRVIKKITKDTGNYYTSIRIVGAASSRGGSPQASTTASCTDGWTDYQNSIWKFEYKIPPGWTDDSLEGRQSETLTHRTLISTTRPEEQVDPNNKISYFEIIASQNDLKKDENYRHWFDNNTGNQIKTQVNFKGVSAEKYVDEIPMPAGNYHREIYYLKNKDIYYLLSLGIYTTPEFKEKNEATLKCFLENFELIGQKKSDLIPCPDDLLSTTEQLKEQQEEWWTKPDPCESRPEQKVCGYIRSIYDNGEMQIGSQEYRNLYCYCSFFEKNGSRTYRGTQMFALGYKEGACQK